MLFRVIGPLEVTADGVVLPLGPRKQQSVLALLALNAGRAVVLNDMIDELWGDDPPASAVPNIRGYAASLRRTLATAEPGRDRLVRTGSGYALHTDIEDIDLSMFSA